jgi:3-methylcrotonyl-CoA carboxylase alpha subunit
MFEKILIANRGEIACRVAATARRMGIRTVAVYSDADREAAHVSLCDESVHVGAPPARESYLNIERIVEAARRTDAQAIHPGYGFLSENPAFAAVCAVRGIVLVGPPVTAIEAMGDKAAAKALMQSRGISVVPGYHGARQEPEYLEERAVEIGFPVIIKACAGGGGRGMRIVNSAPDFAAAFAACQRESLAAFGDATVLVERYLRRPRHVEFQVFADHHGQCIHLFERDCSIQRRHQKLIEESPAPGMTAELRERMGQVAVSAARHVGYVGAGTVEFIVESGADGELRDFYFMEMNTRLQVEHPVTELVTGLDLVEWQLRVAAGERLPLRQEQVSTRGHALEARLCAERPERNFLPSTGRCELIEFPPSVQFEVPSTAAGSPLVRVDSGVRTGDVITPFYDAMIAKMIVWAPDRRSALATMDGALARTDVRGFSTNAAFLGAIVRHPDFADAQLDTHFIAQRHEGLLHASRSGFNVPE